MITVQKRARQPVYMALFALAFFTSAGVLPVFAEDAGKTDAIVIVATRRPTRAEELGSSVTVITAEEIERKQDRTLPDVLKDVPGLNIVQTGSPGGVTPVFMRGTNSNHTKVFLDGIDIGDPSTPSGAFDFSQLLASAVERVEVLRGPQSGLYGADAIGGVINIVTKKGSGPALFHARVEGGSFGTFNQDGGVSGSVSRFNYALNVAHFRTDSTRVTPTDLIVPGRPVHDDSYDNRSYSAKLGADLTDNFGVDVVAHYFETALGFTSDDALGPEALSSAFDNRELFTRGVAHLNLFDGRFDQTLGVSYSNYRRRGSDPNVDPVEIDYFRGSRVKIDYQGNIALMKGEVLVIGAEHQRDSVDESSAPGAHHIANNAGYVELQSSIANRFFNTLNIRYDANDQFGARLTYRAAPAILIHETGTKLKASVGTGYKAPSLEALFIDFPQFNFFANPALRPETSIGYDAGFEQSFLREKLQFGATYFHNNIRNLIDFNDSFTTQINVGRATTYGVESFIAVKPIETLTLRADYTFTRARDEILDQDLGRRPKNKISVNAAWQATPALSLSTTLIYVGSRIDAARMGFPSGLHASPYATLDLAGSYDFGHGLSAFARIDNLLDRRYQDPIGFLHERIGVFGGLKIAFGGEK